MATYLLLRDNKNSGPYTLEALLQLGLKAYDLVWVEGKSAAWRYPSEVDDLKFYAPVVEEQPYDRFYKKPSEAKNEAEKKQVVVQQEAKIVQQEVNYIAPEEVKQVVKVNEVKTNRKQVFVSLPANTGNTIIKKPEQVTASVAAGSVNDFYNGNGASNGIKKTEQADALSYSSLATDYNKYQPRDKKVFHENDELPLEKQAPVETKYAQSLDDIKDMYVQTLADRKRKTAQKKMIIKLAKRGLPFAAVLIAGFIMGGLLMNKKSDTAAAIQPLKNDADKIVLKQEEKKEPETQTVVPQTTPQETAQQQQTTTDNTSTPSNQAAEAYTKPSAAQKDLKLDKNSTVQLPFNAVKKFVNKQNEAEKTANTVSNTALQKPQNIEADPQTGERNKLVRSATESNKENSNAPVNAVKNGLMKQVKVNGNQYKVGTFGGIHDLELTVVNNSNFLLDHVMVELQYLKPSDQPLKTNNVQFDNVPPNGSLTVAIPATNRGMKVVYKVINVQSKAAGNDTAAAGL